MSENYLTLEKFEEAAEIVKKVTLETKLVYTLQETGFILSLRIFSIQVHIK